jgi:hypothetical protein
MTPMPLASSPVSCVPIPQNKGNGAREALTEIETASRATGSLCWADHILMELWARGFKVVPLEPNDRD